LPIAYVDELVAVKLVAANDHSATCGALDLWAVSKLLLNVLPKAPEACMAAAILCGAQGTRMGMCWPLHFPSQLLPPICTSTYVMMGEMRANMIPS
jgi:hypothetical protein